MILKGYWKVYRKWPNNIYTLLQPIGEKAALPSAIGKKVAIFVHFLLSAALLFIFLKHQKQIGKF
jgi:hypothetical protein